MTKPLIQQLIHPEYDSVEAFIAGWGSLGPIFVKLCAHLDEQAADKPEPPKPAERPIRSDENWVPYKQHQTDLDALRKIPGATGAGSLLAKNERLGNDLWQALEQRNEARAELGRLEAELENSQAERATSNRIIDRLNSELAKVTAERNEARAALARVERELNSSLDHAVTLTDIGVRNKQEANALRAELAKVTAERDALTARVAELTEQAVQHRRAAENARGEVKQLRAELAATLERLEGYDETLSALDKPAAAVAEPREIRVGSVWRHKHHGMTATVQQVSDETAHVEWDDGERRAWPRWHLVQEFEWVSDPDPTAEEKEK